MPSKDDRYTIDQSPLYRLATKKKLAQLLHTSVRSMLSIVKRGDKNYNVFEISQRGKNRTVEHPKTYLEKIHKRLFKILRRIKTPEYLHSGIRGRSYISNAKAHRGNHPVAKIDIKGFYPSTTRASVFRSLVNTFECASDVADVLANLITYSVACPRFHVHLVKVA